MFLKIYTVYFFNTLLKTTVKRDRRAETGGGNGSVGVDGVVISLVFLLQDGVSGGVTEQADLGSLIAILWYRCCRHQFCFSQWCPTLPTMPWDRRSPGVWTGRIQLFGLKKNYKSRNK